MVQKAYVQVSTLNSEDYNFKNCSDVMSDQSKQWSAMGRQCLIIAIANVKFSTSAAGIILLSFVQHQENTSNGRVTCDSDCTQLTEECY